MRKICLKKKRKKSFSQGTRPTAAGADQHAYDNRQEALFGSVLRGSAAHWCQGLAASLPWTDFRDKFLNRFINDKDNYRRRTEAENINRQPD